MERIISSRHEKRDFFLISMALIYLILMIWVFYPGFSTFDYMWMQMENAIGRPSGWHPPLYQKLLSLTSVSESHSNIIMFLNVFTLVLGILFMKIKLKSFTVFQSLVLLVSPILVIYFGGIYKVSTATVFLFAAWTLSFVEVKSFRTHLIFVIVFFLGASSRDEIIICSLPIIINYFWTSNAKSDFKKSFKLGLAMWTSCISALILIYFANNPYTVSKSQILAIYDLAQFSIDQNKLLYPEKAVRDGANIETLKERASAASYLPSVYHVYKYPSQHKGLYEEWIKNIFLHPLEYLKIRTKITSYALGVNDSPYCAPFDYSALGSFWGPEHRSGGIRANIIEFFSRDANSLLFKPFLYLITLVFSLAYLSIGKPANYINYLFLGLSGVLQIIVMFFILSSCDRRYLFWPVFVSHVVFSAALLNLFEKVKKSIFQTKP